MIDFPPNAAQETIVITASVPTSKNDITQGVVIIDRSHALSHSITGGIGETLSDHTGIKSTFYGPNASRPIIRGLGEDRIKILSNGLLGIDASTISPDHAVAIDGLEAQKIEVLKGSSALRYGANAVGGVVNIIDGRLLSIKPEDGQSGDLFIGTDSATHSFATSGNFKYANNGYYFRLDALKRETKDYEINGFSQSERLRAETLDETMNKAPNTYGDIWAFGVAGGKLSDTSGVSVSYRKTKSEYGIPFEEAFIDLDQSRYDLSAFLNLTGFIKRVNLSASFGDYTHAEIEDSGEVGTKFTSKGHELRLEALHKSFNGFNGIIGFDNLDKDFDAEGEEAFIKPVKIKNTGVYFTQNYRKGNIGVDFGVRYDIREYKSIEGNRDFDGISSSIGASYKLDNLRFGVNYARTERPPTEVELYANGPHAATQAFEIGNINLSKEIANSYEASINYNSKTTNIAFNVWRGDFDKFISFEPTGEVANEPEIELAAASDGGEGEEGLQVFVISQKDAELSGFEFEVSQYLGEYNNISFLADLGIDSVKGKYKNGGNIARIPPMSYKLGLEANYKNLSSRLEIVKIDDQNKTSDFETRTEGAEVINIDFGYAVNKYEVFLNLKNLTDENYREHTSPLKEFIPRVGRSAELGLRIKF